MPSGCPGCGQVIPELDELRQKLEFKERALRDAEHELRNKRAQISRMKGQRDKDHKLDPQYEEAMRVFEYWKSRLAPDAREFTGKRWDNVVARLRAGFSVAELERAIDGCALRPYVDDGGRKATGSPDQRNVDLELICRTEGHVKRFISYLEAEEAEKPDANLIPASRILAMQGAIDKPKILQRLHALRGWTANAVLELGLGLDHNKVVFFAQNSEDRVTGFSHYQPNKEKRTGPKNVARGARELFPPPEEYETTSVWLVEGEPDAVAIRSAGLPGVAVPGVATWKDGWAERFEKFDRVYVCFDCDDEGRKAMEVRVAQLGKVTHAVPVDLDPHRRDGYDVGDLLLEKGESTAAALSGLATVSSGAVMPFQQRLDGEAPYERIKKELEAHDCKLVERHHGQATAQCPNHDDRQPSLSLSEGDDGRVLLHCHAGCTTEEITDSLGLKLRDLFERAS